MAERDVMQPLPFPAKGVVVEPPAGAQPPETTARAVNVRLNEMITLRNRGGSRSGLRRYLSGDPLPGLVQDLNTVAWIDEEHLGAVSVETGDFGWVVLAHPGTYVIGFQDDDGFKLSSIMAVDDNGIRVGQSLPGKVVSSDQPLLLTPITLPDGHFVASYWQPGAYPSNLTPEDFPGNDFLQSAFPTGAPSNDFAFPAAGTPGFSVPGFVAPDMPMAGADAKQGFQTVKIRITFQLAYVILLKFQQENIPQNSGAGVSGFNTDLVMNGDSVIADQVTRFTGSPNQPLNPPYYYILSNDLRPLKRPQDFPAAVGTPLKGVAVQTHTLALDAPTTLRIIAGGAAAQQGSPFQGVHVTVSHYRVRRLKKVPWTWKLMDQEQYVFHDVDNDFSNPPVLGSLTRFLIPANGLPRTVEFLFTIPKATFGVDIDVNL